MTAINIPSPEGTGDWHFHDAIFGTPGKPHRYFIAGTDFKDDTDIFGDAGVSDCKPLLAKYGAFTGGGPIRIAEPVGSVYAANHYRASADLLLDFIQKGDPLTLYSIDDWFSLPREWETSPPTLRVTKPCLVTPPDAYNHF
jgi:hypothetical protein